MSIEPVRPCLPSTRTPTATATSSRLPKAQPQWLPSASRPGADRRSRRQRIPSRHNQSVFSSALSSQPPDSLDHTRPPAPVLFMLRFTRPAAATTCWSLRPDSRRQQYQACRVLSYLTLTSTFFGLAS